eukprot:gnl/MRDRNA2_/MRDRNA2_88128_c0_seq1.p1 gnl/MRDRNA2_/MRDRNA2_88128_c0~~gnl/MRDRNA2_/MRDRNA2_88128_c0_seq1.p1  ORF type:complete len:194 (+),score=66.73 gnl/MRDRNA2_/MRDRNA2_88128_c0_seq1:88-669(+)
MGETAELSLTDAQELRKRAVQLIGESKHAAALEVYEQLFKGLYSSPGLVLEDAEKWEKLVAMAHLNASICHFVLDSHEEAINQASQAIAKQEVLKEEHRSKVLFIRAQAFAKLQKWDDAATDVQKALDLAPKDAAMLDLQRKVVKQGGKARFEQAVNCTDLAIIHVNTDRAAQQKRELRRKAAQKSPSEKAST